MFLRNHSLVTVSLKICNYSLGMVSAIPFKNSFKKFNKLDQKYHKSPFNLSIGNVKWGAYSERR